MADSARREPAAPARRRPLESYNKAWLGFGAIAVVAVLIGAMLLVKVADVGYRHYTARFLQAAALQTGNPITIAGIPVGEVTSMKLAGDHVEAGLKVRKDVILGEDSRAIIKVTTILGSRYLALEPDGPGSLPDNTFDVSQTEVPYDLQEALADVTTTYEQVDSDQVRGDTRHPRQGVGRPSRGAAAGAGEHPYPVDDHRRPARPTRHAAADDGVGQQHAAPPAVEHRQPDQPGQRSDRRVRQPARHRSTP